MKARLPLARAAAIVTKANNDPPHLIGEARGK